MARFERAITQLRIIAILTTFLAIGAGITALVALREPTAIRIGAMQLDGNGLVFDDGEEYTRVSRLGVTSMAYGNGTFVKPGSVEVSGRHSRAQLATSSKHASFSLTTPDSHVVLDAKSEPWFFLHASDGRVFEAKLVK